MICKCCYLLRHIPRQMVTSVSSTGAASRPPCHMLCFRITQFQPIFEQAVTAFHSVLERHELRSPCTGSASQGKTKKGIRGGDAASQAPDGVPMPPRGRRNIEQLYQLLGNLWPTKWLKLGPIMGHSAAHSWAHFGPQKGSLLGLSGPTARLTPGHRS